MQLVQNDPAMEQAWGVIKHLSADERERAEAEAVEKARRDLVSRLRSAEIKGHTAELAEGKAEVAHNLLHLGLPIAQISEATGLSPAEIEALRQVQ